MADPRTRPYPPPSTAHQNGPPSSRERAFNDIFSTGRPIPPPSSSSQVNSMPNGNGTATSYSGKAPTHHVPTYTEGRNYPQMSNVSPTKTSHQPPYPTSGYQEQPGLRSPPSRQYAVPNDGRGQPAPRQNPYGDPRMQGQLRQASAPHPQQLRMYNDIPPSHQRPPQEYSPPNGNDYRTKSLQGHARPPPPPSQGQPHRRPVPQDGYPSIPPSIPPNRMNTTADGRIVPQGSQYEGRSFSMNTQSHPQDRSFSLTTGTVPRRPDDRSYTLTGTTPPDRTYPATRVPPSRRPEEGRSMTISGRMGSSPPLEYTRPAQGSRQPLPGSPRRPSGRPPNMLTGVREEGPGEASVASRHESVDSTSSEVDPSILSSPNTITSSNALIPQRTKSSSSFPTVSPSSATGDRRPSLPKQPSSQPSLSRTRAPIVYPALLSRVAIALRERLILGDKQKDGLTYPNAFTGSEAVDLIAYVIKTSDRNLALLLGRALDAQRWFHDVTYVHRYPNPSSLCR